ncbi:MAG: nucleotidyltransferase domain-containing protein [Firmicutes bacterium]|nr:nucleotidyltransferase domain-containing protein [Bacillota bacterium]
MAEIPLELFSVVKSYIDKLRKEIPVDKALLFGSYAKGTYHKDSDVDLAIFSDFFKGKRRVEATSFLLARVADYRYDIEPIGYPFEAYKNYQDDPFVREIVITGIEIT